MTFGLGDMSDVVLWHVSWILVGVVIAAVGITCGYSLVWICLV